MKKDKIKIYFARNQKVKRSFQYNLISFLGDRYYRDEFLLKQVNLDKTYVERQTKKEVENFLELSDIEKKGIDCLNKEFIVRKTKLGKPYFENKDIFFSNSHTENFWGVAFFKDNIGFDLQVHKGNNIEKIARRFFDEAEENYVKENGLDGFYHIWTRKEAFGKYTGQGFFGKMPSMVASNSLVETTDYKDEKVLLRSKILNLDGVFDKVYFAIAVRECEKTGTIGLEYEYL